MKKQGVNKEIGKRKKWKTKELLSGRLNQREGKQDNKKYRKINMMRKRDSALQVTHILKQAVLPYNTDLKHQSMRKENNKINK